ncbi:MAG: hypothetical protein H0V25_07390, partial [Solirubrobacterales bacterium]|nr:hypothetical protein [Solirubrobacterales bacterium]
MIAMLALASIALGPLPEAQAAVATPAAAPRITIAMLPQGTEVQDLVEAVPGIAPGLLSAGLGDVPSGQTYLDIGQGSRLARSLYPKKLPPLYVTGNRVPARIWRRVRTRAAKAPADIVPGLLASTLGEEGVPVAARPFAGSAALIAADRSGRIPRVERCPAQGCPGLTVERVAAKDLD